VKTPSGIQGSASEVALARSAAYGLLALAFRYPEPDRWSFFVDHDRWKAWPETLNMESTEVGDGLRRFQEHFLTPDPARVISVERAQVEFSQLFGHAVKSDRSTYELEYGAGEVFQRVARLADLQGFYKAFGLELEHRMRERADHVSVECEFMSVMAAKEAYAEQEGDQEGLATVREASGRFLESHLGAWLPSLARRISEAKPGGIYGALAGFVEAFIRFECSHHGVSVGHRFLELRSADEDEETVQRCAAEDFGTGCPTNSVGSDAGSP
jgi:DMSO reductase family type II enzyme chaperone